jgi:hypothetical protein
MNKKALYCDQQINIAMLIIKPGKKRDENEISGYV